jgi:hypothetical protein
MRSEWLYKISDHFLTGAILGLLAPFLSFYLYYKSSYGYMGHWQFIKYLQSGMILVQVLTMCVLTNLLVFFVFIWTKKDRTSRGILFSTFIYAGFILYMKFLA